jgi:hypothetical protein
MGGISSDQRDFFADLDVSGKEKLRITATLLGKCWAVG